MPCYQTNEYSVLFRAENDGLLRIAAQKMGGRLTTSADGKTRHVILSYGTIAIKDGIATGQSQSSINTLKQNYSVAAIERLQAKNNNFTWTKNGLNKWTATFKQQGASNG